MKKFFLFFWCVCFSLLAKAEAYESFVVGKFQYKVYVTVSSLKDTIVTVSLVDRSNLNLTGPLFQDKVLEISGTVTHNGRVYRVKNIDRYAFTRCNEIESVIIGEGIEDVDDFAFWRCTRLRSVSLPSTLRSVDDLAFAECYNLCEIKVDKRNPVLDSRENCNALIKTNTDELFLGCRSTTIPKGIKRIADLAFADCVGLEQIVIPEGVVEIGGGAFYSCINLKSISLPHSLETLDDAFSGCHSLKSLYIPENVSLINEGSHNPCYCPFGSSLAGCLSLDTVIVDPRNKVYDSRGNALVETATGTLISGFRKSRIVEGIRSIGTRAFAGTVFHDKVYIPKSVVNVSPCAFEGCEFLDSLVVDPENPVYDSRENCNGIVETATGTLIRGHCRTTFAKGVTDIGDYAFSGCRLPRLFVIPEGIRTIGEKAFSGYSGIQTLFLPASLEEMGDWAFSKSSVQTVCWQGYVEEIGACAFYGCRDLYFISIPEGTRSIASGAFEGCRNLNYVSLPSTLEYINDYAFSYCPCEDLVKKNHSSIVSSKVRPIEKARQK